jgi:electron transfer flavoprotein alpha subunit
MSVLIFAEAQNKKIKKAGFEAVNFGHKVAEVLGKECIALTLGEVENASELGKYGAAKILNVGDAQLNNLDTQLYIGAIEQVATMLQ